MNTTMAKCSCNHCSEHISFEAQFAGQSTACPHCGMDTLLFIPKVPSSAVRKAEESKNESSLIGFGYIFAILFPIIGFIIGIVLLARRQTGHGIGCMVISLVCAFVWMAVLNS